MRTTTLRRAGLLLPGLMALSLGGMHSSDVQAEARASKDAGPASAVCDRFGKETAAWLDCVGASRAAMSDSERFYAGYWLAKNGQYDKALSYLKSAGNKDERILTYIGFATRKLGDVDGALPFYAKALDLNPGYAVARAYLGEAYLTKGEPAKAEAELAEIERRCGTTCAEYAFLEERLTEFRARGTLR